MNQNQLRTELNKAQNILNNIYSMLEEPEFIEDPEVLLPEEKIKEQICIEYNVNSVDLDSKKKIGNLDFARLTWCFLLFKHVTKNKTLIAKKMNRKSHSSVVGLLNRANDMFDTDRMFRNHIQNIRSKVEKYGVS